MLAAALCGALSGAVAGCLALFGLRAWERKRKPVRTLRTASHLAIPYTAVQRSGLGASAITASDISPRATADRRTT
jgi:hypothetical protein